MTYYAAITSQGQVSIPAQIRKKYGFSKNGKVVITENNNGVYIKPVLDIESLKGSFQTHKKISQTEIRSALDKAWSSGEV